MNFSNYLILKNNRSFIVVALFVFGVVLYLPSLKIGYYADDLAFLPRPDNIAPLEYLVRLHPGHRFYRPVEAMYLTTVEQLVGLETSPIHLLNLAGHLVLTYLVFFGLLRLNFTSLQATLSAVFMLIGQSSVIPIGNVDTISQVLSTVFGYLMLWSVYSYKFYSTRSIGRLWYVIAALCFALSLLSKETSIGFLGLAYLVLVYRHLYQQPFSAQNFLKASLQSTLEIIPFLIILIGYYILRQVVVAAPPPRFGVDNRYGFNLGPNIVINLVELGFFALTPISSVFTIIGLQERNVISLLITVILNGLTVILIFSGLRILKRWWLIAMILGMVIFALFPTFILNHISELHTYNIRPLVAAIEGITIGLLVESYRNSLIKYILWSALVIIVISNVVSIRVKLNEIQNSANRGAVLVDYVRSTADKRIKDGDTLLIVDKNSSNEVLYSVFVESDRDLLNYAGRYLKYLTKINDLKVEFANYDNLGQVTCDVNCVQIELPTDGN